MKPALFVLMPVALLQAYWTRLDFVLLIDNLLIDDTFYYLQVVRNIAEHGHVSFDGIHVTTGFQPLWVLLLLPLALVVEDRIEFVRCVLLFSVFLNLAAGLLLTRVAALLGDRSAGLITAWLWAGYMLSSTPSTIGMESPALALAFTGFLMSVLRGRAIATAVSALFLARTDALLFTPLAAAFQRMPVLLRGAASSFLMVLPYLAFNLAVSDRLLPVSGSVKRWHAGRDMTGIEDVALRTFSVVEHVVSRALPLEGLGASPFLLAALATPVAVLAMIGACRLTPGARRFFSFLSISCIVHVLSFTVLLGRFGQSPWYFVPEYASACLFLGVVLGTARWRLVAPLVAVLLFIHAAQAHARMTRPDPGIHRFRYELASEIGRTLPPDAVIGSWNAGELGYFAPQRVVNLDGLANDGDYLDFIRAAGDVRDYLEAEGITYIADYNGPNLTMPLYYRWDVKESFHGLWPLSELDVLLRGPAEYMVFRLRNATAQN